MDDELIGYVAVDSGQVLLVDPCYLSAWRNGDYNPNHKDGNHYEQACEITLKEAGAGEILISGVAGTGVVSGTYDGDGQYPVYAERDKDGRIKSLTIKFV